MRTNNHKVRNVIISVYFVLIVLAILLATVFRAFSDVTDNPLATFLILVLSFAVLFFWFILSQNILNTIAME